MEGTQSSPIFLHLHFLPPNSLNNKRYTKHFFRIKALSRTHSVQQRRYSKQNTKTPKPFAEKDAFPASLPLHTKNPHAIYKDIQRFARQDRLKEALTIMDYMEQQGIPVNPTTFSSLISACARTKSLNEGKQLHTHIRINGLENNEFLRTKLVHMYTSCGSVEDAKRVFDECSSSSSSSSSVYPWNALLRGTVISGRKNYRDVLHTYHEMREMGVEMNVYSYSNVIKSFAGASAFKQGLKMHALLIKDGMVGNQILSTSLIDLYFKCGKIRLAHKVFEEVRDPDIVAWCTMIAGFSHNRRNWEALDHLRWMVNEGICPNSVVLTTVLPVLGELQAEKLGREVHGYAMKTKSYSSQIPVQSGLIDMYSKCGNISLARRVFYSSTERNAVSWTALMSGYVSNGRPEQALRSVVWMQQEGFRPDVVTVATVIPVCAELKDLKHGKEIHAFAVKNLFFPNVSITTSLIKMYSKCGVLDYSFKLFDSMESGNVKSWTAMIDSYVENGCLNEALQVFRSMQLSKHRPDSVTMARMLSICNESKALKLGKEIHGHILKKDFEFIPFVAAEIVKMYGSCGLIHCAKLAFDLIPVKGSFTWTAIIESYGYNNLWRDAVDLFDQMISKGFTPNPFTFNVILSICDAGGFADDACRIFKLLSQRYKLAVSEEHYSIIIGLLLRSGRIKEAERFMQMKSCSS